MKMFPCWVMNIPGRFSRALLPLAVMLCADAQPRPEENARLKSAVEALQSGRASAAIPQLESLRRAFPAIEDYLAYWLADAYSRERNWAAAARQWERVRGSSPVSPLLGRTALLVAAAHLELGQAEAARSVLAGVPPGQVQAPEQFALAARASAIAGDQNGAVRWWREAYIRHPASPQGAAAASALARLPAPPLTPEMWLERAAQFSAARQYQRAEQVYVEAAAQLKGLPAEQARVRAAAAAFSGGRAAEAANRLQDISLQFEEAEAERLHWLALCHRRLSQPERMLDALAQMERKVPLSPWRQKALVQAANSFLVTNEPERYLPLYSACASDFPHLPEAPYCHWWVVWRSWLDRRGESAELLQEHLRRYPASEKAAAALYYLGRWAERSGDLASALRYWREAAARFPNGYYGVLARNLLERMPGEADSESTSTAESFLKTLNWPQRERSPVFRAGGETAQRLHRARLLAAAGLEIFAEQEMRFGARNGANPWPLALELARTASGRGAPAVALRHIKGTVPSYLHLPRDAAPKEFWEFAFPLPYRARIEKYARQHELDPFLIAALIRQESEFDPSAVSSARAMGLMQVMPATGRELSRRLGIQPFHTSMLHDPETSIRMGTYYLKRQLEARGGQVEDMLAAYNAGPTRIPRWRSWGDFREPSEFVETIPLQQTRDYVQIILRNADVYRWLYEGRPAAYRPDPPAPRRAASAAAPKKALPKKAPARKAPARTAPAKRK